MSGRRGIKAAASEVSVKDLRLNGEMYRTLTVMSYSKRMPLEKLINEFLKKQIAIRDFQKNGFHLVHREIIKTLAKAIPDEILIQEAKKMPMFAKKTAILNVGSEQPDPKKYIKSFPSFMDVNGHHVSVNENEKEGPITFFTKPNIPRKYSLFWSKTIIKLTLASIAEVTDADITESQTRLECKKPAAPPCK